MVARRTVNDAHPRPLADAIDVVDRVHVFPAGAEFVRNHHVAVPLSPQPAKRTPLEAGGGTRRIGLIAPGFERRLLRGRTAGPVEEFTLAGDFAECGGLRKP